MMHSNGRFPWTVDAVNRVSVHQMDSMPFRLYETIVREAKVGRGVVDFLIRAGQPLPYSEYGLFWCVDVQPDQEQLRGMPGMYDSPQDVIEVARRLAASSFVLACRGGDISLLPPTTQLVDGPFVRTLAIDASVNPRRIPEGAAFVRLLPVAEPTV